MEIEHDTDKKIELEKALHFANFTILYPDLEDIRYQIESINFRQENSRKDYPRSSLKFVLKNNKNCLSIKLFNYDWSPPAYDCPALWKNHREFQDKNIPEPRPYKISDHILWIGYNYRNKKAASISMYRTQVEIAVIDGNVLDTDLIEIVKSLSPINDEQLSKVISKSFAEMSYGYPEAVKAVKVPITFWKTPIAESGIKYQRAFDLDEVPEELNIYIVPHKKFQYALDSVFTYQTQIEFDVLKDRVEYIYQHTKIKGVTIRLLRSDINSKTFNFPPTPDTTQLFKHEIINIHDVKCYYSYRNNKIGPHETMWQKNNYIYLLLVQPMSWTTRKWFIDLLNDIVNKT